MFAHTKLFRLGLFAFLICLALAPSLAADVLTVGTDGPCDFADLQDAIDAAWDGAFIRVQAGWHGTEAGFRVIQKSLTITGGYEKCWGEQTGETTLYAKGNSQVLSIRSLDKRSTVRLVDMQISGALPEEPAEALRSGVLISGDVDVEMERVRVHHAAAIVGAGIHISGLTVGISERRPTLFLIDSRLHDNRAENYGGGLSCDRADLAVMNSTFDVNQAQAGAGANLIDCQMFVVGDSGPLKLADNFASRVGAGLSLSRSDLFASPGKDGRPGIEAVRNFAGLRGGAIQIAANSSLRADGVLFKDNIAVWSGGALSVSRSVLDLGRGLESCWTAFGCQVFENNFATVRGGAIFLEDSRAYLEKIMARDNAVAHEGAFVAAFSDSALELTNGVLTENKGPTLIEFDHADSLKIISSTIYSNDLGRSALLMSAVPHVHVSQSIFAFNGAPYLLGGPGARFDCTFFDNQFPIPAGAVDPGLGDPLFRAPGSFRLAFDSPAAEMCDDSTPHADVDFDFEARPSRGRYEPGADELD